MSDHQQISQAMKQLWAVLATAYPNSFLSALGQYGNNASKLWQSELSLYGPNAILAAGKKAIRLRDPKSGQPMQFPPTLPMMIGLTETCWAEQNQLPDPEEAFKGLQIVLRTKQEKWPSKFLFNLYLRINEKYSVYNWQRYSSEKQQREFPAVYSALISDFVTQNNIQDQPAGLLKHQSEQKEPSTEHPVSQRPDFNKLRKKLSLN